MRSRRPDPVPRISTSISRNKAIESLRAQLERGRQIVSAGRVEYTPLQSWAQTARAVIVGAFGQPSAAASTFDRAVDLSTPLIAYASPGELAEERVAAVKRAVGVLESCVDQLEIALGGADEAEPTSGTATRIADLAARLEFLADGNIKALVMRDLRELERIADANAWKSCLLLYGSVLEAVLIDVLDRRRDLAQSYMSKREKFPDDASLGLLIRIAGDSNLIDGTRRLLSESAAKLADAIVDHRDLIHPHRELRGSVKIDAATVDALLSVLVLVVRDLSDADTRGDITAYVAK